MTQCATERTNMENPATWTSAQKIIHTALYNERDVDLTSHRVIKALKDNRLIKQSVDELLLVGIIDSVIIEDALEDRKPIEERIIGYSLTTLIYNEFKKHDVLNGA